MNHLKDSKKKVILKRIKDAEEQMQEIAGGEDIEFFDPLTADLGDGVFLEYMRLRNVRESLLKDLQCGGRKVCKERLD